MLTTTSWLSLFQTNNLLSMTSIVVDSCMASSLLLPKFWKKVTQYPPVAGRGGVACEVEMEAVGSIKKVFECRICLLADRLKKRFLFCFIESGLSHAHKTWKLYNECCTCVNFSRGGWSPPYRCPSNVSLSNVFHEMTVTFFEWYNNHLLPPGRASTQHSLNRGR